MPIVVMTAYGELATAVAAVRNGAFDYLTKPFDLAVAQRAIERAMTAPPQPAAALPLAARDRQQEIVGSSPPMQEVFKRIALVAPSDACVHVRGESGTGKELVARAIHRYSRRRQGPFVAVNMASLSPTLAESELFGHVRGAFTGAEQARQGLLEQADGGTIFLDEVADIPLSLQVKLLRMLEHGEVRAGGRRLPGAERFPHDLGDAPGPLPAGGEADVPPRSLLPPDHLRDRAAAAARSPRRHRPELVRHFLDVLAAKNGLARPSISPEALAELQRRHWYGNVRELRNAIEHAMILAPGGQIGLEHLPPATPPSLASNAASEQTLAALLRQWTEAQLRSSDDAADLYDRLLKLVEPPVLRAVAQHFHGQCAAAARRLGLHRTTLRKKLDELGLPDDESQR